MEAYTYRARGGVFANTQTGNVILMAVNASEANRHQAGSHLWPILAFLVGVTITAHIRAGSFDGQRLNPIAVVLGAQVAVLVAIGFVPGSEPHAYVTVPIAFLAAVQTGLFRTIGELGYFPVATTGNLLRWVESGYAVVSRRRTGSRRAFAVYSSVVGLFAVGAVTGAVLTQQLGVRAAWVASALLAGALIMVVVEDHRLASAACSSGPPGTE